MGNQLINAIAPMLQYTNVDLLAWWENVTNCIISHTVAELVQKYLSTHVPSAPSAQEFL